MCKVSVGVGAAILPHFHYSDFFLLEYEAILFSSDQSAFYVIAALQSVFIEYIDIYMLYITFHRRIRTQRCRITGTIT